jgi:tRNA-splicing ligase RtcB (3'-phosphate/5'-hydroxy nucleic acid ligase)
MYTLQHNNMKLPAEIWAQEGTVEQGCIEQVKNMSNLPFAFHHVVLNADGHQGYGMPIGGVLATEGVVIPNAVGVDIGCGMCALKTPLHVNDLQPDGLKNIMGMVRELIPVGRNHHKDIQPLLKMPIVYYNLPSNAIVNKEFSAACHQVGTLGGGNHFIELQRDEESNIWVMIHSGSRNIGLKVAEHYNQIAKELNSKWKSSVPPSWDLAFLPLDSEEGKCYLDEMVYCVEFALCNRRLMMERICSAIQTETGVKCDMLPMINIAHNYAAMENHFGKNVMVHRKGATRARAGEAGIIPGSQGTNSYIVTGRGNIHSFQSCSHGAGRKLGRNQARLQLDLQAEIDQLNALGIVHSVRTSKDLDEAPGAYKDIDEVMENQKDLVDIAVKLTPLAVIKG